MAQMNTNICNLCSHIYIYVVCGYTVEYTVSIYMGIQCCTSWCDMLAVTAM